MAAMQSMSPFVAVSSCLRNLAQDLVKISHDLRLMDSGPKTGLKEIKNQCLKMKSFEKYFLTVEILARCLLTLKGFLNCKS